MIRYEQSPGKHLLTQFCQAYNQRNLPAALALFHPEATLWGSGLDEYRTGLKEIEMQLQRDWQQSEAGEIEIISFAPTKEASLWAAVIARAKITIEGRVFVFENLRGTVCIEQTAGAWKIAHFHSSFPDMRNPENHSFPVQA